LDGKISLLKICSETKLANTDDVGGFLHVQHYWGMSISFKVLKFRAKFYPFHISFQLNFSYFSIKDLACHLMTVVLSYAENRHHILNHFNQNNSLGDTSLILFPPLLL